MKAPGKSNVSNLLNSVVDQMAETSNSVSQYGARFVIRKHLLRL
jgi:hypothetical protein